MAVGHHVMRAGLRRRGDRTRTSFRGARAKREPGISQVLEKRSLQARDSGFARWRERPGMTALGRSARAPQYVDYPACRAGEGWVAGLVGTFQISSAYSRMVRSDENHAIRATLRMPARVQAEPARQRASMPRWAS